ncbi:hypothetical protein [Streptomyces sp. NPDC048659]|uniref:hypothetical protein n=1 Tax=Streptomyces sp. NPDC048659 TaxID=3155489 RepID=UPI003436A913
MTAWDRPEGGREPAAAALLGWLADPGAPSLCLVSGPPACGKSSLLAWLIRHGSRTGTAAERTVHAVVPVAARSVAGSVWALAEQLGIAAASGGELAGLLARDGRRTVLVLPNAERESVARLAVLLADAPGVRVIVEARTGSPAHRVLGGDRAAVLDLGLPQWTDPESRARRPAALPSAPPGAAAPDDVPAGFDPADGASLCAADPQHVTALLEAEDPAATRVPGLRAAWFRAGPALVRDTAPAERAVALLLALGPDGDPGLRTSLEAVAAGASWRVNWRLAKGNPVPPWPGPVVALAPAGGEGPGAVLALDPAGTVRRLAVADGAPLGRLPGAAPASGACVLSDGSVLLLHPAGGIGVEAAWSTHTASTGIEALLQERRPASDALASALRGRRGTALVSGAAPGGDVVALGRSTGEVLVAGAAEGQVRLHDGPVTAVSVVAVPVNEAESAVLVYSGGADGAVRLWVPGGAPMDGAYRRRSCAVAAVHAARTPYGPLLAVAWSDGLLELCATASGRVRAFHAGRPARAVCVTPAGEVLVGLDDALVRLSPDLLDTDGVPMPVRATD